MRRLLPFAVVTALALVPASAGAKTTWLCRPGLAKNPCTPGLSTTLFSGWDQQVGVITPRRASRPKADCFFVYPTVSDQKTTYANLRIDPELRSIALYLVSRYSQYCRIFAPVYRQVTVPSLLNGKYTAGAVQTAYHHGVLAAWREYLARYNHGRPFMIIGHSQGGTDAQRLVREQVEGKPRLLRRLLSVLALGSNVTVKAGGDVGGTFRHVRACRTAAQLHCAIAFSTYEDSPPADAGFGRAVPNALTVGPTGYGYQVLCTNPAALGGGAANLDSISPTAPFAPGTLIAAGIAALGVQFPQASTTYIEARGAYSGRCVTENGATVLRIQPLGNSPMFKASPSPQFGLHLIDASIAQGDLLNVVKAEIAAYERSR